jgi:predicted RNA-binding Zn-ribbon protein involved in translation (DUF1610 family)
MINSQRNHSNYIKDDDLALGDNNRRWLTQYIIWVIILVAVNLTLSILFPFYIAFPLMLVFYLLLSWYIRRRKMNKLGLNISSVDTDNVINTSNRNVNYYCMSCGKPHNEYRCPECGSKMKKASF